MLEFLYDALKPFAVLLCTDVSLEAALALCDDLFEGFVQLRNVPNDVRVSTMFARSDLLEAYCARALTVL